MDALCSAAQIGVSTARIDELARKLCALYKVESAFLNYQTDFSRVPYPSSVCVSLNEEIVHGIPRADRIIQNGDIVSIDFGIRYNGLYLDGARTIGIGKISARDQSLIDTAREALERGINAIAIGKRINTISEAIQSFVEQHGFGVIRDLVGHGIGRALHEEPAVPNFVIKGKSPLIEDGLVIAIEPMICAGNFAVEVARDGWTVKMKDGKNSAHFEDTIAITSDGSIILTR
ncbi:MAG: type I methionyl aminopeptidase [Parcubacteria group bacterium]|nr:type I methionyl aminopeptidase [Parcubacteria group bacterium]